MYKATLKAAGLILLTQSVLSIPFGWAQSGNQEQAVMILLNDQDLQSSGAQARSQMLQFLSQSQATEVKPMKSVNVIRAHVSSETLAELQQNPAVQKVITERPVQMKPKAPKAKPASLQTSLTSSLSNWVGNTFAQIQSAVTGTPVDTSSQVLNVANAPMLKGTCPDNGKVMLEPEALEVMHINSDDASIPTARGLGFTGAGVRIAVVADGIDVQNVNFIRPNGQSAIVEYLDFSGDGIAAPTTGGEAFLDHSSIGGQGLHVYDISKFSAQPLPSACNVRIEGAAPGADMAAFKGFSSTVMTTNAAQLTAVDYAINEGTNDIINESFGQNLMPDSETKDILELLNKEAVRRGIIIVTASGDSGPSNTVGNPGITSPEVLNMGASTTLRLYAQTNYANTRYFGTGWLNDNMSSLSSGGYGQSGRTVDGVAPGDSSFVSCTGTSNFTECTDLLEKPSEVTLGGGTSEAAPLTSGTAAMIIEAYRQSHNGAKPGPALVKQIITSTAIDLSIPAVQQGSGLVNAYKAVLLASVINGGHPTSAAVKAALKDPKAGGLPLLISQGQLNHRGAAGAMANLPLTITNPSATAQHVRLVGHTFGDEQTIASGTVTLSDATSAKLTSTHGDVKNYEKVTFNVPAKSKHLTFSFAYQGTKAVAAVTLFDPAGRVANYSTPQGVGNHGQIDVRAPAEGQWTAVVMSLEVANTGVGGPIPWKAVVQNYTPFGTIDTPDFILAGGESRTVNVSAVMPALAGDSWGSIAVLSNAGGTDAAVGNQHSSVSVILRSLVDVGHGGKITGTFTGGIGRDPVHAQTNYYQFKIGAGHQSITADLAMSVDPKNILEVYLVDPAGLAVAFGKNTVNQAQQLQASATALNPMAGIWTLVVDLGDPVVGDAISQTFNGQITLDRPVVGSSNLPNDSRVQLAAGQAATYNVTVTNNTSSAQAYFVDARLNNTVKLPLLVASAETSPTSPAITSISLNFPMKTTDTPPAFVIPTESQSVQFYADASSGVALTFSPNSGDPQLWALATDKGANNLYHAVASYTAKRGSLTQGVWGALPGTTGGLTAAVTAGTVAVSGTVETKAFDASLTSATGDYWLQAFQVPTAAFNPVLVQPGQSATLQVTVNPAGTSGQVVSGTLYINSYVFAGAPDGADGANEVAQVPYSYSIK